MRPGQETTNFLICAAVLLRFFPALILSSSSFPYFFSFSSLSLLFSQSEEAIFFEFSLHTSQQLPLVKNSSDTKTSSHSKYYFRCFRLFLPIISAFFLPSYPRVYLFSVIHLSFFFSYFFRILTSHFTRSRSLQPRQSCRGLLPALFFTFPLQLLLVQDPPFQYHFFNHQFTM